MGATHRLADGRVNPEALFHNYCGRLADEGCECLDYGYAACEVVTFTEYNRRRQGLMKKAAPARRVDDGKCRRCAGTGKTPFTNIQNGVCFRCNGTGRGA